MSLSRNPFIARFRSRGVTLIRRAFFWLPSRRIDEEKRDPDRTGDHKLLVAVRTPHRIPRFRQLRYAGRTLSPAERKFSALSIAIFAICAVAGVALALKANTDRVPVVGGSLVEALIGEPNAINPLDAPANDVDEDLTSLIFSGLYRLNGTEPAFDLAERADWSEDRKTLTVTLRGDAVFHSGDPVIAEDVLYTIDAIQDPSRGSPLASKFRGVQTSILDAHTVQFTLEKPDALFEHRLTVGILPARLWQDIPAANARLSSLNTKPIGSGPYRFKSFTRDSKGFIRAYTLERFSDYYGEKPFIKTLVFQFYPDRAQAEEAFKANLVDSLAFSVLGDGLQESPRWHTINTFLPQETVAFLNLKSAILKEEAVRKALIGVVDRQEIVDAWKGRAVPVFGPFPFDETVSAVVTLDEARAMLDGAGWKIRDESGIRSGNTSSSVFEITVLTSNHAPLSESAETLKRRWSLLGIRVNVEAVAPEELLRRATRDRNVDIVLTNVLLDPEQDLFPFWWSGQATDRGFNLSNLSDRDVDGALEAIREATSTEALAGARRTAAETIRETYPAVFLVRPAATYLVAKHVKGVEQEMVIAQPSDRFNAVRAWYVKTGWRWKK